MTTGTNYLQQNGKSLIQGGFNIIPIKLGLKRPIRKQWQKIRSTPDLVDQWVQDGDKGIGVSCKHTPAIDLDILDKGLCEVMIQKVREVCGQGPVRIGHAPKVLLPFRTSEPFKKIKSTKFTCKEGKEHLVEILCDGQQFIAYNTHKDTGQPYQWDKELTDIDRSELQELNKEEALEIVKFFEDECVARGWTCAKEGKNRTNRVRGTAPRDANSAPSEGILGLSVEEMQRDLDALNPEGMDYEGGDSWLTVGMGICHETGGSDVGFNMWLTWSKRSSKHNESEMPNKWKSFTNPPDRAITFRTIREMANRARLDDFLERYVYIQESDTVHDLHGDLEDENPKLKNFKNMHAGVKVTQQVDNKTKTFKVADIWLNHSDRKSVVGLKYIPSGDDNGSRIIEHNGKKYLNPFHMPSFPEPEGGIDAWGKLIAPFTEHMEYLLPIEEDREWFLSWMAYNIQFPEKRCKVAPLHIAIHQGTGRGWLVKVMEGLLGVWNCYRVKMKEVVKHEFTDHLDKTLLCSIEEVREGTSKGFEVNDAIRDVLIEDRLMVNIKHGTKRMQEVFANFFMMSNHPDALIIKDVDRRINVFKCDEAEKPDEVYDKIYRWQEGDSQPAPSLGMCALYHTLKARDLKGFNWKRSLHNEAREEMILNRQSVVEEALDIFLENPPYFAMTTVKIVERIKNILIEMHPDRFFEPSKIEWEINRLLSHRPFFNKKLRINKGEIQTRIRGTKRGKYTDEEIKEEMRRQPRSRAY